MLREKIGSATTTSVSKVLPTEGTLPKFEITAQGSGKIAVVDVHFMGKNITLKRKLMAACTDNVQIQQY